MFFSHSGLEADQKVIAAHGCYAMTATTALTAQNTKGVYGIHHVPAEFLRKQIDAVVGDVGVDAVKTGVYLLPLPLSPPPFVFVFFPAPPLPLLYSFAAADDRARPPSPSIQACSARLRPSRPSRRRWRTMLSRPS